MAGYTLSADVIGGEELAKALNHASDMAKKELADALNKTAVDLVSDLADPNKTPHKSGRLAGSFPGNTSYASPGNLAAIVGTNVEYARAQEYGTVGQTINVKNGRRTRTGGRTRPYTYIGNIKPKFYMKKAMETIKPKMTNYLQDAGRRIVAFIARG
jgi:HK97 gp10 family phage protein